MRRVLAAATGVFFGLSVFANAAHAQPPQPGPVEPNPGTSTSEELADMVMDVIEDGTAGAPSTTPVPAP